MCDEESKKGYINVIKAKLTGSIEDLRASVCDKNEVYSKILRPQQYLTYADLGAYNGDTIRELAKYAPNLKKVYALEPDQRTFRKLSEYSSSENRFELECHNCAAWNRAETLFFDGSGNRNSNISGSEPTLSGKKAIKIEGRSLDDILGGSSVDYIKYDVEGSEFEALEGSSYTIKQFSPDMLVSLYHRSEDLFKLPLYVNKLGNYRLYLRRFAYYPAWDLNLYAIQK